MPLTQIRKVVTAIPGPRSVALMTRKARAVAPGVATTMPVFAVEAAGGIVRDADDNQLIDLGSGIAVTTVGVSAPRVVEAVAAQAAAFTHTCFMVTPYEAYVQVAEALNRLTPGRHEKRTVLFNSGARRSRTPSRSPARSPASRPSSCSTTPTTAAPTSRWP